MTYGVIVQGAIASTESKKGAKAFKELLESLGAKTAQEPAETSSKSGGRRATPALPPTKGRRDPRVPPPPPRRNKIDEAK